MKTRPGITLIEVLVAIFIMAIGLLSLLTLFPLGALSMADALRDQRNSEAALQAYALANAMNVRTDPAFASAFYGPANNLPANYDGRGYPVFVDAWGLQVNPAATTLGPIPRANTTYITNAPNKLTATMQYFGLQDEMSLLPTGLPDVSDSLQRDPKTTWAYWLQRPNNTIPNVVELSIVVYSNRNLVTGSAETLVNGNSFNPANNGTNFNSANPTVNPSGNPTDVTLPVGTDIRRGMWILDITPGKTHGVPRGRWYRVVAADDTGSGVQLELQPVPTAAITSLIVMEDVAEVFPKGTGWK